MKPALSDKGRAVLAQFHQLQGTEPSGLVEEWRNMAERERVFWLNASGRSKHYAAQADFNRLPGDVRATIKNNLYRAAKRAETIIKTSDRVCG